MIGYTVLILFFCLILIGALVGLKAAHWGEALWISVITFLLSVLVLSVGLFSATSDTEIWNGAVTSKDRERVSCEHSYQCNCREVCTGSGKDRTCSTVCDTCYEHSYDYDWMVRTTIGNIEIDRIDRQGSNQPPRWSIIKMNDPVAKSHTYTNYIKGAKRNVLNREGVNITYPMPAYPSDIYDYYYINRAVDVGAGLNNIQEWNTQISLALRQLGPAKEVNLVLVFTKYPQNYSEQLNSAWTSGKKNDVIVVMGIEDNVIAWTKVLSWTKREDFKIGLRDELVGTKLDPVATIGIISKNIDTKFDRREMAEFEYLKYDIDPPAWSIYLMIVFLFVPTVVFYFMRRNENVQRRVYSNFGSGRVGPVHRFINRFRNRSV